MNFNNRVVVITGASKGFGKALARAFRDEQARVVITGDNEAELKVAAEELGTAHMVADVRRPEDAQKVADFARAELGSVDVWINNAGIQIAPSDTEGVAVDKLRNLFDINFFGYFYGCQAALSVMKPKGSGLIINVNSTAGLSGKPGLSAYVSSKFAVKGLSETIRQEVQGTGVELYQVFPGGMKTDIYKEKIPADIGDYMDVDYAVGLIMANLRLDMPDPDLVIRRPNAGK